MASNRPKLSEIIERISADAEARLDSTSLRRSDLKVFIRVLASASHALYSAIEYGRKQLFWDSSEGNYLERRASVFGLSRKQATKSVGTVQFSFSNDAVDVPIGTVIQTTDNIQYVTTSSPDSDDKSDVRAVLPGSSYTVAVDEVLTLVSPIAGVLNATVTTEITGGTNQETDDELRARALEHTQNPPRQGTKEDFVAWAKEVEGVGSAWCYPKEFGDGSVTIRFLTTDNEIPSDELIQKVQAYIEEKAFVLAKVYVVAPIAQPIDFTIKITPDTLANRSYVESAIKELFNKEAVPGANIYLSHINAAISAISTEDDHKIILPTENIESISSAYLPTVGEITWQTD